MSSRLYVYFALACGITWLFALPTAQAWMRHEAPAPYAIAGAGLSAFGPLLAVLAVARRQELAGVFGRWRTSLAWVMLALFAPMALHVLATSLFVAFGGQPSRWLHPPVTPESVAALVVFPLGEEFGWRGYAYPRIAERFGAVRGSLLLGIGWGVWHLAYSITPELGAFDGFAFVMTLLELPLYSVLIAWVFERANRSMAVAIAFHAGAHLDHIERAPHAELGLHALHMVVVAVAAAVAARSFVRTSRAPKASGPSDARVRPPSSLLDPTDGGLPKFASDGSLLRLRNR
jgi:membrane protease YdiL (CAAX protease family)